MIREPYRGFIVVVRINGLPDGAGWRALVNIEHHAGSHVDDSSTMPVPKVFKTEQEAELGGLTYGKSAIDKNLN